MGVLERLGSQLSKAPLKTQPSQKLADLQPLKVENLANLLVLTVRGLMGGGVHLLSTAKNSG